MYVLIKIHHKKYDRKEKDKENEQQTLKRTAVFPFLASVSMQTIIRRARRQNLALFISIRKPRLDLTFAIG